MSFVIEVKLQEKGRHMEEHHAVCLFIMLKHNSLRSIPLTQTFLDALKPKGEMTVWIREG